jgi:hypothetical protein
MQPILTHLILHGHGTRREPSECFSRHFDVGTTFADQKGIAWSQAMR